MWKHAEPGPWRRRLWLGLVGKLLTKWLRADLRFYAALWGALGRWGLARAAHRRERAATTLPLREAFARIRAAWPPKQLGAD